MTIGTTPPRVSLACDGTTKVFPIAIQVYQASDISVVLTSPAGVQSPLTLNSDYTLTPSGTLSPPQQTLTTLATNAYASGYTLQAFLDPTVEQQSQYVQGQAFPSATLQQNVDRLTQMIQRVQDQLSRTVTAPDGDVNPAMGLPPAVARANTNLGFDSAGNLAVFTLLASGVLSANAVGQLINPQTPGEAALGIVPTYIIYPVGDPLRYNVDPTGVTDSSVQLQQANDAAYKSGVPLDMSGLTINAANINPYNADPTGYRGTGFKWIGNGAGPVFVLPGISGIGTTILQTATNNPVYNSTQPLGSGTTSGNLYSKGIRFQNTNPANTAPAVVQIGVLGEYSHFEECEVFQAGVGDGVRLLQFTKAKFEMGNILNADYAINTWSGATAYNVGNKVIRAGIKYICILAHTNQQPPNATYWTVYNRTGCAFNVFDQYNAGLATVEKITCRGFQDGVILGYGSHDLGPVTISEIECSNCFRGVTIGATMSNVTVERSYFEGTEGTCIKDNGRYSRILGNFIQAGTQQYGIDASAQGGGGIYDGNIIGIPPGMSNVTGLTVAASKTVPATVTNNRIVWGSSGTGLTNVFGLVFTGIDPVLHHPGNMFFPNTGWAPAWDPVALTGCSALQDNSTVATGSSGDGTIGFGVGFDGTTQFPDMKRGALSMWRGATLTASAFSAGVLTTGQASSYLVNCGGSTIAMTSINPAVCSEGKWQGLHFINATALTLTQGSNLRLLGTANFTPPTNGSWHLFEMVDNVAWERLRSSY